MTQTVEDLGKLVKSKYPGSYDDMPDADLGKSVKAKYPGAYDDFADVAPTPATPGPPPDARTPGQVLWNTIKHPIAELSAVPAGGTMAALGHLASTAINTAPTANDPTLKNPASALVGAAVPGGPATEEMGVMQAAANSPAANLVKSAWNTVKGLVPNTASAGAKFEQVMNAAKDVPLDLSAPDDAALRAMELRQRGSTLPKVMNDYIKTEGPITYEAGRDFASNAGALSTRETTAMNAKMQRQVAQFATAMKDANRSAAESVGLGDVYDSAMKEYRQAKTIQEAGEVLKKWGKRVVFGALGLKAVGELVK